MDRLREQKSRSPDKILEERSEGVVGVLIACHGAHLWRNERRNISMCGC